MNIAAALGILLISFYLTMRFCKTLLPPFLVSLMVALNVDLMYQSSITYYENWSVFWAMLSALFFIKSMFEKKKKMSSFFGFMLVSALAVSTHERMLGYCIFTVPFLAYVYYKANRLDKNLAGRAFLLTSAGLGIGVISFCLANNIFHDGFGPLLECVRFKFRTVDASPARFHIFGFLKNQLRCHVHALWLIFWNLGGIVPFFSLCGVWSAWKKRLFPAMAMLLFPIGYQVLSVGLTGWTSGRYIMGQTIFATLYAGLGIAWCIEYAKRRKKMVWFWVVIVSAFALQLFFLTAVKVADTYYNPLRVIEHIITDPANKGKKIVIKGIAFGRGLFPGKGVTYEVISADAKFSSNPDIAISIGESGCCPGNSYKKEFRNPPGWLVFLVARQCNSYVPWSQVNRVCIPTPMTIESKKR